jgi:putative RNA 2'-phosphotransferase
LETAIQVGNRHGKCVVLVINAKKMCDDGIKFYLSENGVWLTKYVDWKYVEEMKYMDT